MRELAYLVYGCLALLSLSSCCQPACRFEVFGANEFVIDSYKIREGKFSILEMTGIRQEELLPEDLEEYIDTIQDGDVLNLVLYHPTRADLTASVASINGAMGFKVADKQIVLPDLGTVVVGGLTLSQARDEINHRLGQQIHDLDVFLDYRIRLTRKVELTGMVGSPAVPVNGKIRLHEVLAQAHVPVNANLFMSYVLRNERPLAVDLHKLLVQGDMSQNIVMRAGDKIHIAPPNAAKVMVMGEVACPRALEMPSGFMPLCEALVAVGGIPFTGDRDCIQVIRGDLARPKIYVLSWQHIVHLPNDSLLLMPGDTVYVYEKPITQWNRFISQLLPSVSGLQAGCTAYQGLRLP